MLKNIESMKKYKKTGNAKKDIRERMEERLYWVYKHIKTGLHENKLIDCGIIQEEGK